MPQVDKTLYDTLRQAIHDGFSLNQRDARQDNAKEFYEKVTKNTENISSMIKGITVGNTPYISHLSNISESLGNFTSSDMSENIKEKISNISLSLNNDKEIPVADTFLRDFFKRNMANITGINQKSFDIPDETTNKNVDKNIYKNQGNIVSRTIESLKVGAQWFWETEAVKYIRGFAGDLYSSFKSHMSDILGPAQELVNLVMSGLKSIYGFFKSIFSSVFEMFGIGGKDKEEKEQTSWLKKLYKFFVKKDIRDRKAALTEVDEKKEKSSLLLFFSGIIGAALFGLGAIIGGFAKSIVIPFQVIIKGINQLKFIGQLLSSVGSFLKGLPIVSKFASVFGKSFSIISSITSKIGGYLSTLKKTLTKLPMMGKFFKGILFGFRILGWKLQAIFSLIDFIQGFKGTEGSILDKIMGGFRKAIIDFFKLPIDILGWLVEKTLGMFGVNITGVGDKINKYFGKSVDVILGAVKLLVNAIIAPLKLYFRIINFLFVKPISEFFKWVGNTFQSFNFDDIKSNIMDFAVNNPITRALVGIVTWFGDIFDNFSFEKAKTQVLDFIMNDPITKSIMGLFNWFKEKFETFNFESIKSEVLDFITNSPITKALMKPINWIKEKFETFNFESIKSEVLDFITNSPITKALMKPINWIKEKFEGFNFSEIQRQVTDFITNNPITKALMKPINWFKEKLETFNFERIKSEVLDFITNSPITKALMSPINWIKEKFEGFNFDEIQRQVTDFITNNPITKALMSPINWIKEKFESFNFSEIQRQVTDFITNNPITKALMEPINWFKETMKAFGVGDVMVDVFNFIIDNPITKALMSPINWFKEKFESFNFDNVKDVVSNFFEDNPITNALMAPINWFKKTLSNWDWKSSLKEFWKDFVINNPIVKTIKGILSWFGGDEDKPNAKENIKNINEGKDFSYLNENQHIIEDGIIESNKGMLNILKKQNKLIENIIKKMEEIEKSSDEKSNIIQNFISSISSSSSGVSDRSNDMLDSLILAQNLGLAE